MATSVRAESDLAADTTVRQSGTDFELDNVCRPAPQRLQGVPFGPSFRLGPMNGITHARGNRAPGRTISRGRDLPRKDEASLRKDCLYWFFCSLTASSGSSSAFCQLELGLYSFIALAATSVFLPRSF